jgi:hypothetical protein
VQAESLAGSAPEGRYRAKVVHYPDGGFEAVVWEPDQFVPGPKDGETIWDTAIQGEAPADVWERRPRRRTHDEEKRERNRQAANRRARSAIRRLARARGYDRLLTFTTRQQENTVDELLDQWDQVRRLIARHYQNFSYLAVPEPHPTNPRHWHLHVAVKGYMSVILLRRLWLQVLRATADTDGAVNVSMRKGGALTAAKLAGYLAKYIGKQLGAPTDRFDRKRYWHSRCGGRPVFCYYTPAASDLDELRAELLLDESIATTMADFFSPRNGVYWFEGIYGTS